ncbi:Urease accessory protein UreE [Methylophaga frappieri]|uniref:Urease accessory protein UreE n=1 Tax=Methylophaga frappieri (strain ATCC BAA-2434 / DSM 25690 / JAM7) TaxID=754477 RepID=I1YJC4_METFJ|nr:urease accessory protein UreE [Methylophaga frappieri]AFJ03017.1 Urease accessory protein UreE [Methylophaga frappieri]
MLSVTTKLVAAQPEMTVDDVATLSYDLRQKSRIRVTLESGSEAAFYLKRGTILRGGDFLQAESGEVIAVVAADQAVMRVTAKTPQALAQAAYHLGNRHVPLEIGSGWLKLEQDSVLQDMLIGLGVQVELMQAPFEPESGAYSGGVHHHHDDGHHHSHGHHSHS